jgi:hypothetical protein
VFARFGESVDFRMRVAGALVRTVSNHHSFIGDNAGTDHRIWRGATEPTARLLQRSLHPLRVRIGAGGNRHHFS